MIVKFKKLHENAVIPSYAKLGDAGLDLTCINNGIFEDEYVQYNTGLSLEIPKGYVGLIFPRSSISNYGLVLSNSVGVIDSGYRGELKFRFRRTGTLWSSVYKAGDRIGQLVILPYPNITPMECDELSSTSRGDKGFGSTN